MAEKKTIRYSVIIPAYNAGRTLPDTLAALKQQTISHDECEVIVVDDGSTDDTADAARRFGVNCIGQANRGPAAARNHGARVAKGDIILFTDADCSPDGDWLRQMTLPFQNEKTIGVKGAYRTNQKAFAARFAQAEFEDRYDLLAKADAIDMVDTYSAAFRKDIFIKIGLFDESFPVANNEDTELSYRMCAAGYRLEFNPEAIVYHLHPDSFVKYLRLKFKRGYWRMIVYRNYPGKALRDTYTPVVVKLQTMMAAFSIISVFFSIAFPKLLTVTAGLCLGMMVSSVSFSIKTFKKDPVIGLISPVVVLGRSLSFALGVFFSVFYKKKSS
ncbi:MAG: glycosyl transferase family 2 [Deltaproteobacteria bacterium HGW-Deltaproteobacteria-1]|jgi:cellulose synthase/poly-beta-1,6-N-acetylglucosamine synthase-like glycosyltransferase|nr:MAG: glycosyl transferase family 2 [Deltaproteobacteria bacterium HGW-Deltaproteobacteria-1]